MISDGPFTAHPLFRSLVRTLSVLGLVSTVSLNAAQLRLQWDDNSADESGFKIERAEGSTGAFAQVATVGANIVAFDDTNLAEGKLYRYRVRAYNGAGDSAYSNVVEHSITVVNTAPTISSIAAQTIKLGGSTSALGFTIGDSQTAATSLVLSVSSSNTLLVPASNIVLGGSGANRTVTVSAADGRVGEATVTLNVSDGSLSASSSFKVTVVNTAPTITAIANQTLTSGSTSAALSFTVGDAETAATTLSVTRNSSNTTVLPLANIAISGTGATRSVSVTVPSGVTGSSVVTLTVSDGLLSTSTSFTVNAVAPVVTNTAPTISSIAAQSISSSSSTGPLAFTVGDKETLSSSLVVTATSSNLTLVPATGLQLGGSGASRTITVTPAAGKTGTATITIQVSDGSLTASTSFALTVGNHAPTVLEIMDQVVAQNMPSSPIQVRIGDVETLATKLTVTAVSSQTSVIPTSGLVLGGTGANRTLTLYPARNKTGNVTITVTVSDGALKTSTSFEALVTAGKDGPQISNHPVSRFVKSGTTVSLAIGAFGSPSPSFQWRKNGVEIAGATGPMLTLTNVQASAGDVYDVVVSNNKGTLVSHPAIVAVNPPTSAGTHQGILADGEWIMLVRNDQTALYLASLPYIQASVALELELQSDGTATVVHTAVGDYMPVN